MATRYHKISTVAPFDGVRRMERSPVTSRTTTSTVTFAFSFVLPGYSDELPAGTYEVIAEDELLANLSFEAYRRTATHIQVVRSDGTGRTELRPVEQRDLDMAVSCDQAHLNQQ